MPKKGSKKCFNCQKITAIPSPTGLQYTCTYCGYSVNAIKYNPAPPGWKKKKKLKKSKFLPSFDELVSTYVTTAPAKPQITVAPLSDWGPPAWDQEKTEPSGNRLVEVVFKNGPAKGQVVVLENTPEPPPTYQIKVTETVEDFINDKPELDEYGLHKKIPKINENTYHLEYYVVRGKKSRDGHVIGKYVKRGYYVLPKNGGKIGGKPEVAYGVPWSLAFDQAKDMGVDEEAIHKGPDPDEPITEEYINKKGITSYEISNWFWPASTINYYGQGYKIQEWHESGGMADTW